MQSRSVTDRVSLQQALVLLAENEGAADVSPARLVDMVRDYPTARGTLPPGVTLAETAQFHKQKHPAKMPRKTVAEAVAEFIADRRSAGSSPSRCQRIRRRPNRDSASTHHTKAIETRHKAAGRPRFTMTIKGITMNPLRRN